MTKELELKRWKAIANCYSALGKSIPVGTSTSYFHCKYWRNPVMSPFFVREDRLLKGFHKAEFLFKKHKPSHFYDSKSAYVNLLNIEQSNLKHPVLKKAADLEWNPSPKPNTLNGWESQLPINLPKSIHFVSGRYFDKAIYAGFLNGMTSSFNSSPQFMRQLNMMMRAIEANIRTVLLYHESGKLAGSGLVATANQGAFLFCGSIEKPFRGRGLWSNLVAIRQMISAQQGAKLWVTTTHSQRILEKGEFSYPLLTLTKNKKG